MKVLFRGLVVASFFVSFTLAIFGQGLPTGAKLLSADARESLISQIESGQLVQIESKSSFAPAPFVFMKAGDYRNGASIYARNPTEITQDVIVLGVRRYPGAPAQYLEAMMLSAGTPAGSIWYDMDIAKKSIWNESGGIATYEILVIQGGRVFPYRFEQNYNNYNNSLIRAHTYIRGGNAIYDSNGNLTIHLFGSFSGQVSAVVRNENGWEWVIPSSGISSNQHMVTLTMSTVENFEGLGDVQIALVDGTRQGDVYKLRVHRFGTSLADGHRQDK